LHADNSGGTDEEFVGRKTETAGGLFDCARGGEIALWAGGAIGVAGVHDYGAHVAFGFGEMFFGESDGSGYDEILREDGGGRSGNVAGKEWRDRERRFFEAAGGGGKAEAFGEGGFGGSLGHLVAPIPRIRFSRSAIAGANGIWRGSTGDFFAAREASTVRLWRNLGRFPEEIFCSSVRGSSIQFFPLLFRFAEKFAD